VLGHLSSLRPNCVRSFPIGWLEYFLRELENKAKDSRQRKVLQCVYLVHDGNWQRAGVWGGGGVTARLDYLKSWE
jgi:hypothetical protein